MDGDAVVGVFQGQQVAQLAGAHGGPVELEDTVLVGQLDRHDSVPFHHGELSGGGAAQHAELEGAALGGCPVRLLVAQGEVAVFVRDGGGVVGLAVLGDAALRVPGQQGHCGVGDAQPVLLDIFGGQRSGLGVEDAGRCGDQLAPEHDGLALLPTRHTVFELHVPTAHPEGENIPHVLGVFDVFALINIPGAVQPQTGVRGVLFSVLSREDDGDDVAGGQPLDHISAIFFFLHFMIRAEHHAPVVRDPGGARAAQRGKDKLGGDFALGEDGIYCHAAGEHHAVAGVVSLLGLPRPGHFDILALVARIGRDGEDHLVPLPPLAAVDPLVVVGLAADHQRAHIHPLARFLILLVVFGDGDVVHRGALEDGV